jgi:urea transport system ATP-binding protein
MIAATAKRALYIDGLTVAFGAFQALTNLSLLIHYDEIRAIIGPNGAGKTTLLDVLTGKTHPKKGQVVLEPKQNLLALSDVQIALAGVGRKFQKPSIFEALSVEDNLRLAIRSKSRSIASEMFYTLKPGDEEVIQSVLAEIGLAASAGRLAGTISHGEKQWLEIGMLLVKRPKILLLDEPVAGMTDEETAHTAGLVKRLKSPERAIVVIEHDMSFVREVADVVTVLHQGKLLLEGPMSEVSADPRVIDVYLGRSH